MRRPGHHDGHQGEGRASYVPVEAAQGQGGDHAEVHEDAGLGQLGHRAEDHLRGHLKRRSRAETPRETLISKGFPSIFGHLDPSHGLRGVREVVPVVMGEDHAEAKEGGDAREALELQTISDSGNRLRGFE